MNLVEQLKQKKVVVVVGGVLIILVIILLVLSGRKKESGSQVQNTPVATPTIVVPTDSFTPEQLKVIEEQRVADTVVADREKEIKTKYPWFLNLPLRADNYFVYFDQNNAKFVGRLYPKATDDVQSMKADVMRRLKDEMKITDVDTYPFEWVILPE